MTEVIPKMYFYHYEDKTNQLADIIGKITVKWGLVGSILLKFGLFKYVKYLFLSFTHAYTKGIKGLVVLIKVIADYTFSNRLNLH